MIPVKIDSTSVVVTPKVKLTVKVTVVPATEATTVPPENAEVPLTNDTSTPAMETFSLESSVTLETVSTNF